MNADEKFLVEAAKVEKLAAEVTDLSKAIADIDKLKPENDPELAELLQLDAKLTHRLAILDQAIEHEMRAAPISKLPSGIGNKEYSPASTPKVVNEMIAIESHLKDLFTNAMASAFPQIAGTVAIVTPLMPKMGKVRDSKLGDYQCNSAMTLSRTLREVGIQKSPKQIAEAIVAKLEPSPLVAKVDVAPAGFINLHLNNEYIRNALIDVLRNGVRPPKCRRLRVIVDFSSPNIAKEMHVGHLRSTIIGESISCLLEYLQHDVVRVNHIGDWGTQFGMLIAHLEERFPNYLSESPPISDLQAFYKESKKRFDEDEKFKKRAYSRVVALQSGDPNSTKAWQMICDVSRKEFQTIYERLGVKLTEKGESFYQARMVEIVKYLEQRNLLENDDGRKIMWTDEQKTGIPLTIVKSDGGYTYDTSDMAAIRYRLEEEKADWIIYVVDVGQQMHFQNIFRAAERCGILKSEKHRVDHVGFGVVLGEDGKKFKTRSGDTVKLSELLDEGLNRAMAKLKEKERDKILSPEELQAAQKSIAYGCIKYADLVRNRTNEYVFSFDRMLEDRGNTAVYLLYAYTRICSISRNFEHDFSDLARAVDKHGLDLKHEKELKLGRTLLKFPDVLLRVSEELMLHPLCEFCYEVCTVFSEFYDECFCIEKNAAGEIVKINYSRILLCEATAAVLRQCFFILGLQPVSRI